MHALLLMNRSGLQYQNLQPKEGIAVSLLIVCRGSAEVSLPLRADLRQKILAGQVDEAHALVRDSGLLPRTTGNGLDVYFFVKCQAFVELVR